jgi:uncharacterized protein
MIIDAHSHVLMNPRIRYTPETTTFMSAEQQIAVMDKFGIDKAVILPMSNPEILPEYQGLYEVLEICKRYPGRFIPFCNVDPRLTGSLLNVTADHFEFILNQYKDAGCMGLGEISAKLWWDDRRVLNLFEACQRVGFPVTFHTSIEASNDYGLMDDVGFPRFEKVLKMFPKLKFFGHSQGFWAEISGDVTKEEKAGYPKGPVAAGGAVVRLMENYPNLYGDISANSGLNAFLRDPEFAYRFIEKFQDRLLFGLDYCSPDNERKHIPWLQAARDETKISSQAYDKIMYRNIAGILNIEI